MKKIIPHLWFDKEAVEAAELYSSIFENSSIESIIQIHDTPSGTSDTVEVKLSGQEFIFISAGPIFQHTPAISLMVHCSSKEEVNRLWEVLSIDGTILIELSKYPSSEWYGWVNDRYGVSWQILLTDKPITQKIVPHIMYSGKQVGKAKEAIEFYTTLFENSTVEAVLYDKENSDIPNKVQYAAFTIEGHLFSAMDSMMDHDFTFNEAFSILVNCENQEEIDFFWDKLSSVPEAEQCGWLKDRFGVSWQISPRILGGMLATKDEKQKERVVQSFLQMKKMDIAELERAYNND